MAVSARELRFLLAHLNDSVTLAESSLAAELLDLAEADPQTRAAAIRNLLLECVEFLRPARLGPFRSPEARPYHVLWLRYVEGLTVSQVSEELALSERQTHRELRRAEAKLARILSERLADRSRANSHPGEQGSISPWQVESKASQLDLLALITKASSTVAPLARKLKVMVLIEPSFPEIKLVCDEGILHLLLIQALSLAIQRTRSGKVLIQAEQDAAGTRILLRFQSEGSARWPLAPLQRLAAAVEMSLEVENDPEGATIIALKLAHGERRTVLVVEDDPGAALLYRRYLETAGNWQVVSVAEPRQALELAKLTKPAAIILDLLMPEVDGWSVLTLLRSDAATAGIPVIVCSVFSDPLLAQALGVSAYLRKPISQPQLLHALRQCCR